MKNKPTLSGLALIAVMAGQACAGFLGLNKQAHDSKTDDNKPKSEQVINANYNNTSDEPVFAKNSTPHKSKLITNFGVTLVLYGNAFPKNGVQPDSAWGFSSNESHRVLVNPSTGLYTLSFDNYTPNDSVRIKIINAAKDTVAKTGFSGTGGVFARPTLYSYKHGLNVRNVFSDSTDEDSIYGRCIVGDDTTYGKFLSNYYGGPTEKFRVYFPGDYSYNQQFKIETRLRDSSAVSIGTMEGKFIDADTTANMNLTYHPGFRDVTITRTATIPETVWVDSAYPLNASLQNFSDLRAETLNVCYTIKKDGVTKKSDTLEGVILEPHPYTDTTFVSFTDLFVPDSIGNWEVSYNLTPSDSNNLNNNVVYTTTALSETTAVEEPSKSVMKSYAPFQTVRTANGLRNLIDSGEYDICDVTGRKAQDAKKGIYFARLRNDIKAETKKLVIAR